jgi:EpsI family protein
MSYRPFWVVILLCSLTMAVLHDRGEHDRVPPSTPVSQFPMTLGSWSGVDEPISQETLDVLGKGDFLSREYREPESGAAPQSIGLFIGYFPTQRSGQSIHSPQNCLPGSGWAFLSSGTLDLSPAQDGSFRVGNYLISDGVHQAEVLYWYQTEGRVIASDYTAKMYMLMDSIRYGRTDAALVRVTTMARENETRPQAQQRAVAFARQIAPLLPAYVPN